MLSSKQNSFFNWFSKFKESEEIQFNEDKLFLNSLYEKLVNYLREHLDVKTIASDFDLTIMSKHSGGYINPSSLSGNNFSKSLSYEFNVFATIASNKNIPINIVTFSDPLLIPLNKRDNYISGKSMIEHCFKMSNATFVVDKYYCFHPKLWQEKSFYSKLNLSFPMPLYKTYHLSQVCEKNGLLADQVFFIDDDIENCIQALKEGYIVLHVDGDSGYTFKNLNVYFYKKFF